MHYRIMPGCSLHGTAREYAKSLEIVLHDLSVPAEELGDWNCCGASSFPRHRRPVQQLLSARNLALAEGEELLVPCALCYHNLAATAQAAAVPPFRAWLNEGLARAGVSVLGSTIVPVTHPLQLLTSSPWRERWHASVRRRWLGLKAACYYGCLLTRPRALAVDSSDTNPQVMEFLLTPLGFRFVDLARKTRCCGGAISATLRLDGLRLAKEIVNEARERHADLMVVACPMCQLTLEEAQLSAGSQLEARPLPVLYFTELMAMGMGADEAELGLRDHLVPPVLLEGW